MLPTQCCTPALVSSNLQFASFTRQGVPHTDSQTRGIPLIPNTARSNLRCCSRQHGHAEVPHGPTLSHLRPVTDIYGRLSQHHDAPRPLTHEPRLSASLTLVHLRSAQMFSHLGNKGLSTTRKSSHTTDNRLTHARTAYARNNTSLHWAPHKLGPTSTPSRLEPSGRSKSMGWMGENHDQEHHLDASQATSPIASREASFGCLPRFSKLTMLQLFKGNRAQVPATCNTLPIRTLLHLLSSPNHVQRRLAATSQPLPSGECRCTHPLTVHTLLQRFNLLRIGTSNKLPAVLNEPESTCRPPQGPTASPPSPQVSPVSPEKMTLEK